LGSRYNEGCPPVQYYYSLVSDNVHSVSIFCNKITFMRLVDFKWQMESVSISSCYGVAYKAKISLCDT